MLDRYKLEQEEKWREWCQKIPTIQFPANWKIQIIPPFGGAMIRFIVNIGEISTSVYLDVYENLGFYGSPYWEIYPHCGDIDRVDMDDVEGLLKSIRESLEHQMEVND